MSSLAVLLFAVVVFLCNGTGLATTIDIHSVKYDGVITTSFNVTCKVHDLCPNMILAIQVSRNGHRELLTLQDQSDVSYNRYLRRNIEAEGRIDEKSCEGRLTATFSKVLKEDNGLYSCTVVYVDVEGYILRETASQNFNVEDQDSNDMVLYLMEKLVSMGTTIQNQQIQMETTIQNQQTQLETTIQNQQTQMEKQENRISELDGKTTLYIEKDSRKSAFLVGYDDNEDLSDGQVLEFTNVIENIGGDYNVTSGVYTAPVDGLYVFHLYALVYAPGQKNVQIDILANSQTVGRLHASDTDRYDQSSVSAVVNLKAGDFVMCSVIHINGADHGLYDFPYSGFTGHLITAL